MTKREHIKHTWKRVPSKVRKLFVLITGLIFIIAAGATGWLPGPGGIPLFLIGIAILATEFIWAERIRDFVLKIVKIIGAWIRRHPYLGGSTIALCIVGASAIAYMFITLLK